MFQEGCSAIQPPLEVQVPSTQSSSLERFINVTLCLCPAHLHPPGFLRITVLLLLHLFYPSRRVKIPPDPPPPSQVSPYKVTWGHTPHPTSPPGLRLFWRFLVVRGQGHRCPPCTPGLAEAASSITEAAHGEGEKWSRAILISWLGAD